MSIGIGIVGNMEVINTNNVKIQNAVLVSCLTKTEIDSEVFNFLRQFGCVVRIIAYV